MKIAPQKASIYQKRFWIAWSSNPNSAQYNETLAFQITGKIHLKRLKESLEKLMAHHVFLHSQFLIKNKSLYFLANKSVYPEFKVLNLKLLGKEKEAVNKILKEETQRPFNLEKAPLWRATLIKKNENQYILLITLHHIIADGNAFSLITKELSLYYNQAKSSSPENQTNDNLEIAKIIDKEKDISKIKQNNDLINFYKAKLNINELYTEISPLEKEGYHVLINLDKMTTEKICALQKKYTISKFKLFSVIFSILIHKYFDKNEFYIDYPINMRDRTTETRTISSLINTQILPIKINNKSNFLSLLHAIDQAVRIGKSATIRYDRVFELLEKDNDSQQRQKINLVISETDLTIRKLSLNGLHVRNLVLPKFDMPYDVNFEYQAHKGKIKILFQIKNSSLRSKGAAARFKKELGIIIDYLKSSPKQSLESLKLIAEKDFQETVQKTSYPAKSRNSKAKIDEQFIKITKRHPNHTAIISNSKKVTYNELYTAALCISSSLNSALGKENQLVGVYMNPAPELIETLLGILLSGRAYVPLNPSLPTPVIQSIIDQAKLTAIVTDQDLAFEPAYKNINLFRIRSLKESINFLTPNKPKINKSKTAYVLYTSGTTGLSKGVSIQHKSVVNLIMNTNDIFKISPNDTVPLFHAYSFDFSVWEIWSTLLNGATLLLLESTDRKSPKAFMQAISKYNVTIINQTPTALKFFTDFLSKTSRDKTGPLKSLRLIICGGEALYPYHVKYILENKSLFKCHVYNMYGITEDCVHSTIFKINKTYLTQNKSIIGKALPGKKLLVGDKNMNSKPIGQVGELFISGYGVSDGYLYNEDLTEKTFASDPRNKNQRWLRTGDYARVLDSGELEYIGRKDSQLKIRGYRIDKHYVENFFNNLEGISHAFAVCIENQLTLFFKQKNNFNLKNALFKARLNLPSYMIPSKLIKLESVPLTTNGKIDQKKLIEIFSKNNSKNTGKTSSVKTTDTKSEIKMIWSSLLTGRAVEDNVNFFDLGGNSLLLYELHHQLEEYFSIKIPIIDLFKNSTIKTLANYISTKAKRK